MQLKLHMVTMEDLMPQEHFLRKLESMLDLSFVYGETRHLYSQKYGRPPIDPVVLVKSLLVGYLYGIPSERQIEQRIQTDVALRWYLGLDWFDCVPDHSMYRNDSGLFWEYWADRKNCGCCFITREMPERERQAGRKKAVGQLFQALGPTLPVQAEATGVPTSPERAADLV